MSFYKQIAPYYHHIFKTNTAQVNFIKSKIPDSNSTILDIGCGIGTLSFELTNYYKNVLGIDMDAEMIRVAFIKNQAELTTVQFHQKSMLELNTFFDKSSVDNMICFGNTLVHLNSFDEIAEFLQQSKTILKSNGKLLLQIVNYDRILTKNIQQLPLIQNDEIIFERNYVYKKSINKIDFNTQLTIKNTHQKIENSIKLLPILKEELELLLIKVGFNNCNFYGNFKLESHSNESPALIVEAW